jgi:hypothetical protein
MIRLGLAVALVAGIGLATSPTAQELVPGRFEIRPNDVGFIRLDTASGAITYCSRRFGAWRCDVLAEDRSLVEALAERIDSLDGKLAALELKVDSFPTDGGVIAALSAGLDALRARVAAVEAEIEALSPPPATPPLAEARHGFAQEVIRRLLVMVREMKRGSG